MKVGVRRVKKLKAQLGFMVYERPEIGAAPITLPKLRVTALPFDEWQANLEEKLENVRNRQRIKSEEKHAREFHRHMCHDPSVNAGPLRRIDLPLVFGAPSRKPPYDRS